MDLKTQIENVKDWLIMTSPAVPYILGFCPKQWTSGIFKRYPENFLITFAGACYIDNGSEMHYLVDKAEYHRSFKKILNDLSILDKLYADFLIDEESFKKFTKKLEENENSLHDNFNEFIKVYDAEYISGGVIDGILVYGDEFFEEMKEKYPRKETEITELTKVYGESFLSRYQKDLLKLSSPEELQNKYYWIKNNYKDVKPMPLEFFKEELAAISKKDPSQKRKELELLETSVQKHQEKCEEIKKSGVFEDSDFQKMFWIGKIAWWVDRRKEYNLIANHFIGKHLQWLCQKYDLNYEDASFLLPWEMDEVIGGKKKISDFPIKERQKLSLHFYNIHDEEIFLVGREAEQLWQKISPEVQQDSQEIQGMVANPGISEGKARIIMDPHNVPEFNEGDILVTGMTRPDFMVLMRKAAAFVTDEGGITCHAAIVSRELNKPCIIGTKIATKVLKDGDMVEVDANKGVVKVIK